jgi:hypothetical protein
MRVTIRDLHDVDTDVRDRDRHRLVARDAAASNATTVPRRQRIEASEGPARHAGAVEDAERAAAMSDKGEVMPEDHQDEAQDDILTGLSDMDVVPAGEPADDEMPAPEASAPPEPNPPRAAAAPRRAAPKPAPKAAPKAARKKTTAKKAVAKAAPKRKAASRKAAPKKKAAGKAKGKAKKGGARKAAPKKKAGAKKGGKKR